METQAIFCLTTKHGALDIFREVRGLENDYDECRGRAYCSKTATGIPYAGLSDEDIAHMPGKSACRTTEGQENENSA
jgi:hypothetical protein